MIYTPQQYQNEITRCKSQASSPICNDAQFHGICRKCGEKRTRKGGKLTRLAS